MPPASCPLYDPDAADARASWHVMVCRFFVFVALLPRAWLVLSSLAGPEPADAIHAAEVQDLNDLWYVEPIRTLDEVCKPRTFMLSPRAQCSQSLKQIRLSSCGVMYGYSEGEGSESMEVQCSGPDVELDSTFDHLW